MQGDTGDPSINAENNIAFLPGRGNVVSSGNFVWSDAETATSTVGPLNGGGNVAFFDNGSANSSIIGDSSMGVFLSSNNSSVSGSQSVGYFMGQTGVTLARDNVFAIMGADLGIGVTNPLSALQINGTNRAESHFDTSDRRWKKNIQALNLESLKVLKEITPVRYKFKTKDEGGQLDSDHEHIGFIAQDVQAVLPDIVREDAEGYLSLETTKMTVLITDAASRLKTENERLEKQIALTQSEINAARDQINRSIESFEDIKDTYHEIKEMTSVNNSKQANLGYILMMIALFIAGLAAGHQSRKYACPGQDAGHR